MFENKSDIEKMLDFPRKNEVLCKKNRKMKKYAEMLVK